MDTLFVMMCHDATNDPPICCGTADDMLSNKQQSSSDCLLLEFKGQRAQFSSIGLTLDMRFVVFPKIKCLHLFAKALFFNVVILIFLIHQSRSRVAKYHSSQMKY